MSAFTLRPVPPFRLDLTVSVLRRLVINEMDRWDGHTYRRALTVNGAPVEISVVQTGPPDMPELVVTPSGLGALHVGEAELAPVVAKILGTDVDMSGFINLAQSDGQLRSLVGPYLGFKPPRLASVFEALVNGIACQQITLVQGIRLLNRLCANYGQAVGDYHAFPRPEDLLAVTVDELKSLGFSGSKARYILTISAAVASHELDLGELESLDDDSAVSQLCRIYGVGRWTAQYVALRGLGRLDVYPADDVGSQAKIQRWLNLSQRPNYEGIHEIVDQWAPYRGLLYFYLLLDSQAQQGLVEPSWQGPEG